MFSLHGDSLCEDCWCESYINCEQCGDVISIDDCFTCNGYHYCRDCNSETDCSGNFRPNGFCNRSGRTTDTGSERCFGLELETDRCDDYNNLANGGAWGAKNDPSCNGKEFYSDILDGDEGLVAIAELADLAKQNNWQVCRSCGYHLHIDMRQENDDSLFAAAYAYRATQILWQHFVDNHRHSNPYCHPARWSCVDISDYHGSFRQFVRSIGGRYAWVNLRAYEEYSTFEIRLHHASLDGNEICNWVKAHIRFVDWATTIGYDKVKEKMENTSIKEQFDIIAREAWQDDKLRTYYARKIGV